MNLGDTVKVIFKGRITSISLNFDGTRQYNIRDEEDNYCNVPEDMVEEVEK